MYDHGFMLAGPGLGCSASLSQAPEQMEPYHKCTAIRKYAKKVIAFSRLSSGFGSDHQRLAQYLRILIDEKDDKKLLVKSDLHNNFASAYRYCVERNADGNHAGASTPRLDDETELNTLLKRKYDKKSFKDCHDYVSENAMPTPGDRAGRILVLHGYPTPQWIGVLGALHHVDSELSSRWLDFRSPEERTFNFTYPQPPASSWNLIELPVVTIGRFNETSVRSIEVNQLRESTEQALRHFHEKLQLDDGLGSGPSPGTGMIRKTVVFDKSHFAVERCITICFQPERTESWQVIVWTDINEENEDDTFAIHYGKTLHFDRLLPSISYRPDMGLKSRLYPRNSAEVSQTTSFLPHDLGASLRPEVMAKDPFYALTEVFSYAISSENQVLNLIEVKLNECNPRSFDGVMSTITNLQYLRRVLIRHTDLIQNALAAIQSTKETKWPKQTNETALRWRSIIERNYTYLYDRARTLNQRCQETIAVLMNTIAIKESKKGIDAAERMGKLTFLAFIFAPLAFTTSYFSMTFSELQGHSLWVWFVFSGPILAAAVGCYFVNVQKIWHRGRSRLRDVQLAIKDVFER